jgi:tetratricopeptide (TPR) repeat protein
MLLGSFYWGNRETAAAESTFRLAIALDSNQMGAHVQLIDILLSRRKVAEARKSVDALLRRFPGAALHETTVLYAEGRRDRMREIFAERGRSHDLGPEDFYLNNTWMDLLEGRLANWDRDAGSSIAPDSTTTLLLILRANYWARRRHAESIRTLDSLLARDSAQRRSLDAATLYAQLGRTSQARAILAAYDSATTAGSGHSVNTQGRRLLLGWVLLDEGRPMQAIAEFRGNRLKTDAMAGTTISGDAEIGLAFARAGQPDSAIASYEHYLNTPYGDRFTDDAVELAWVLEHVAALYEGQQKRKEARAAYTRLVDLWKNADPELQPRVMHARRRLAALSS